MTQAEYWQRRIDRLFDKYHAAAQTKQLYRQAYKKVEQDILRLYEELRDKGRLTTTQLYQYQRFLALRREIQKQCGAIDTALQANVTAALTNAYKETFEIVTDLIDSNSVWGIQNERMVQAVLKTDWSGDTYSRRIWKNTRSVAKRMEAAVTDCITRGTSKDVYVKQIKQTFNVGFNAADRIVRTELMHVLGVAQIDTYYADGIKRVKWLAEIDGRVCAACAGLNGKVFDIEEFVSGSRPVIEHPNCRCTLLPVLDDEDELTDTGNNGIIEAGKRLHEMPVTLPNGTVSSFIEGGKMTDVEVFAGKGAKNELRVKEFLVQKYGGKAENWRHTKGRGMVWDEKGKPKKAMLHWFEEESAGVVELRVKGWSKK